MQCCTGTPTCTGIPAKLLTHAQSFRELIALTMEPSQQQHVKTSSRRHNIPSLSTSDTTAAADVFFTRMAMRFRIQLRTGPRLRWKMSSERQRSDDESPSTSSGSSDADQRDPPVPEPEEQEERKQPTPPQQQKKSTKLSSKTTAKLSSSAKRIQKELAEITLDPPPNC
ncbi:hypothetical protein QQF64_032868, partial [Cirrhinus molitorella]